MTTLVNDFVTEKFAAEFTAEWIAAWNGHDLDPILKHYARDIEFTSPFVSRLLNCNENTLRGIAVLRGYFTRALNVYPVLMFVPQRVYSGARSVVIEYCSISNLLVAEMMEFNDEGRIRRVFAHYVKDDANRNHRRGARLTSPPAP